MTIVEALKKLCTAFGGTSNAKTIVPALKDCATALGGESTAKTASQAIADVADAVEAGGGGGDGDFANLTKLEYTDNDGTLTFEEYTYAEFYNQWADGDFNPYFVYNGETYIFTRVLDEGENYYSAVAHNTETHTDKDIEGISHKLLYDQSERQI